MSMWAVPEAVLKLESEAERRDRELTSSADAIARTTKAAAE
jgi:hypothetical protein